jgi:hypothetical protein
LADAEELVVEPAELVVEMSELDVELAELDVEPAGLVNAEALVVDPAKLVVGVPDDEPPQPADARARSSIARPSEAPTMTFRLNFIRSLLVRLVSVCEP